MRKLSLTLALAFMTMLSWANTRFYDGNITYGLFDEEDYNLEWAEYYKKVDGKPSVMVASAYGTNIEIPETVTYEGVEYTVRCIEVDAFANANCQTVSLPKTVMHIRAEAFFRCTKLQKVILAEGSQLLSIGWRAFYSCTALQSINLPSTARISVDEEAFYGCSNLVDCPLHISSPVQANAFKGCTSLAPDSKGIRSAGPYVVKVEDAGVENLSLPLGITIIEAGAFKDCTSLKTITLPSTIRTLNTKELFSGCTNLTSVNLPSSIKETGEDMFRNCKSLTSFDLTGFTTIKSASFAGTGLTEIVIPASVTKIENSAFASCADLANVKIAESENALEIASYAFKGCTSLKEITLPKNVKPTYYLFTDCSALETVNLEYSSFFNYNLYDGCTSLKKINITDLKAWCETNFSLETWVTNPILLTKSLYVNGELLTDLVIPEGVTTIGKNAFVGCESLQTVKVSEGVTTIGERAFEKCANLLTVWLPTTLTTISNYAFLSDTKLYEVYNLSSLPLALKSNTYGYVASNAKVIHTSADEPSIYVNDGDFNFYHNGTTYVLSSIRNMGTKVVLPANCKGDSYILEEALFKDNTQLTSVVLPESMTQISAKSFYGCTALTEVNFPKNLKEIGANAFYQTAIKEVILPEGLETIYNNAFCECQSIETVSIPSTVNTAEFYAFKNATGKATIYCDVDGNTKSMLAYNKFTDIVFAEGVEKICANALNYAYDIVSLKFPESLKSIGDTFCWYASKLEELVIPAGVESISAKAFSGLACKLVFKGALPTPATTSYYDSPMYGSKVTSVEIGGTTEIIHPNFFYGITTLKQVTIPEGVKEIGKSAFDGCSKLENLSLPSSLKSIGEKAFNGCKAFTEVVVPESVDTIGASAFYNCTGKVIINSNIRSVKQYSYSPFYYSKFTAVEFGPNVTEIGDFAFYGLSTITDMKVPEIITKIGNSAFYNCTGIKDVNLPESLNTMGSKAFYGCTGKLTVNCNIPSVSANGNAFLNGSKFTAVEFGPNVTEIGDFAFYGISTITDMKMPKNIETIGKSAFYNCKGITDFTLPASLTTIGETAFNGCTKITKVEIPASVTSLGSKAFASCTALTSVTINSADAMSKSYTTTNGFKAIFGTQVTEYTIGKNITAIGSNAFYGCTSVKNYYNKATEPQTVAANSFNNFTATLNVPQGSLEAYQAADVWKKFTNMAEIAPLLIGDANADGVVNHDDAKLVMDYFLGLEDESKLDMEAADINGDGKVTMGDANAIINK